MNTAERQVCACCCHWLGVMHVVWWVAEKQTDMTQWMIEYELKELMIQCSRMSREAFDVHSRRKDQAFQWRDADSEAVVAENENNYPWSAIISEGHRKHFVVPRAELGFGQTRNKGCPRVCKAAGEGNELIQRLLGGRH